MRRIIFLVDGFNLYHSILSIYFKTGQKLKWLDIYSLCESFLNQFGKKNQIRIGTIYYFTAILEHKRVEDPQKIFRHETYLKCLKNSGIEVIINDFKEKNVRCGATCRENYKIYQEKETDVAIAAKLFEVLYSNLCDIVIIITGDTDLKPAYNLCIELFKDKKIYFGFPFDRKNKSLNGFKIKLKKYINNQFPDPVILKDGSKIYKPTTW